MSELIPMEEMPALIADIIEKRKEGEMDWHLWHVTLGCVGCGTRSSFHIASILPSDAVELAQSLWAENELKFGNVAGRDCSEHQHNLEPQTYELSYKETIDGIVDRVPSKAEMPA